MAAAATSRHCEKLLIASGAGNRACCHSPRACVGIIGQRAVTKLQALQRGRFTRREFAELRKFSREQESFQQATRRRQIRIWRNEQELYFLQHTNAADLERVRVFQQQHSARVIQRAWRATTQSTLPLNDGNTALLDPSERIYTFDPLGLETSDAKARFRRWKHDERATAGSQRSLSLFLSKTKQCAPAAAPSVDDEAFVSRRRAIQERIKRKAAQEKTKLESTPKQNRCGTTEVSKPTVNRRRELYEQVVAMKLATAQRVRHHERGARASRPERDLLSAQLITSCDNRLKHLRSESPEQMTAPKEDNQEVVSEVEKWDPARRIQAWNHHRRAVCSVLDKQHWWQTQLAGDERDIRRMVVLKSPWEDENNVWVWPRSGHDNQKEDGSTSLTDSSCSTSLWPSEEIHRFLVGDKGTEHHQKPIKPVSDDEASEWWRAHCTQSHLVTSGALFIENPYKAEFRSNVSNEGDIFPVCTSEVVANRNLYELQQRAKRVARTKSLKQDIEQRIKALTAQVERRVHEMESQVEANTQLALEIVQRKQEQRARITREQQATMTIQRYARGMQGRKCARELRAEFFVMVRGRAIRRGRCEECGDQRAVLECQQCEESLHFCPICWVHVHSTRRRKTHVAIPMTAVVAPVPMTEAESAKVPTLLKPTENASNMKVFGVEENTGPRLRSLPSPPKQSATRPTQHAPSKDRNNKPTKQDAVQSATPAKAQQKTTPELTEACALARRVRTETAGLPPVKSGVELTPAQSHNATQEPNGVTEYPGSLPNEDASLSGEIDFSTAADGDGAVVSETDSNEAAPKPVQQSETTAASTTCITPQLGDPDDNANHHELSSDASASNEVEVPAVESGEPTNNPAGKCADSSVDESANTPISSTIPEAQTAESASRIKLPEPSEKHELQEVLAVTEQTRDTSPVESVEVPTSSDDSGETTKQLASQEGEG